MICICNEKFIFNKKKYYIPKNYSMNYKLYSIETNNIINELIQETIVYSLNNEIKKTEIKEDYFNYQEKELNEDYVSTGYFNFHYFLNLGNYLQKNNENNENN
jgi:hypothetical protein